MHVAAQCFYALIQPERDDDDEAWNEAQHHRGMAAARLLAETAHVLRAAHTQ